MWNKDSVLGMLEGIPAEDKQAIQDTIDSDKYINSEILNCDLCGSYASFCECCPLHSPTICAQMYAEYRTAYKGSRVPALSRYSFRDENAMQQAIDEDKYKKSVEADRDLCGSYEAFCENCVLNSTTPCADAYLKYISAKRNIRLCTVKYTKKAN
ncbi:MAG: hypothetical protein LUD19_02540 [Clostridia bacterium]|nr:hypothetical protein [Clostridia bacterium]